MIIIKTKKTIICITERTDFNQVVERGVFNE